jgi:hypothetical protein
VVEAKRQRRANNRSSLLQFLAAISPCFPLRDRRRRLIMADQAHHLPSSRWERRTKKPVAERETGVPDQSRDDDTTRATARLPGLEIEIVHRRPRDTEAEALSITLHAMPSFEAFGRYFETANPLAFWAQAVQMAWLPWFGASWFGASRALMSPWTAPWTAAGAMQNAPKLQPSAQPDDGKET